MSFSHATANQVLVLIRVSKNFQSFCHLLENIFLIEQFRTKLAIVQIFIFPSLKFKKREAL